MEDYLGSATGYDGMPAGLKNGVASYGSLRELIR